MITVENIMSRLAEIVTPPAPFGLVAREVADAINWRAPEERRPLLRMMRNAARTCRSIGDLAGARAFVVLALLLRSSLRAP